MNNIYKVIWSKAKNCYVVASEIARSHTKSASGSEKIGGVTRRSLLASLMALSLLCGGLGVASAANSTVHVDESTSGAAEVYTKTGVDTLLNDYGKKTDVEDNKNNIETLRTTTMTQGQKITENATNIARNTTDIGKKIDTETANERFAAKVDLTALQNQVTGKVDENTFEDALEAKADKTYVDTEVGKKADKTYVDTEVGKKANKATTLTGYGITDAYTKDATDTAITTKVNEEKDARELKDTELSGRIDTLSTTVNSKVSKTDLNTTLGNYYTQAETNAAIKTAVDDEKNARENAINGEVTERNKAIADAIAQEETNRDAAITNAKTELREKVTIEETNRKEEDTKLEGKITENTNAINNEKTAREAAVTDLSKRIGTVDEDGKYIKKSTTNNVSENLKVLDNRAKTNADAIAAEATERKNKDTELEKKITKNSEDIATLDGKVTTAEGNINDLKAEDTELENKIKEEAKSREDADIALGGRIDTEKSEREAADEAINNKIGTIDNIQTEYVKEEQTISQNLTKLDNKLKETNDRTGGITRNLEGNQTTIEGAVKVDKQGNVKDVKGLSAETADIGGALNVTGASDLKGDVTLGTPNGTNTVAVNGTANFHAAVNMDKGLNVTNGDTNLGNTTVDGNLKVTGTITTDKMIFGDKVNSNYTEIDHGKVTSKNHVVTGAGEIISSSSTFDEEKNEVGFGNGITGDQSYHKQTSDVIMDNVNDQHNSNNRTQTKTETKDIITDENGNTSTTSQTASKNETSLKDKDGKNTNTTIDTAKGYDKTIKGENGATSTKQDELNITNTAQNGTITNDAQNIVNNASGNITNKANTMDTNVTGKATESYGSLDTTVNGNETHIVKGTKTETVDGKVTENYKAGQETNVTGNQDIHVTKNQTNKIDGDQVNIIGGSQTTTATDINRNASSSMVDKVDNAYGTNTETKEAGKTTTDVSIKGTEEKGQYIRGANESRDYLIKGTLKNSETKTVEKTSTEITDGNGNTSSTIQDVKNLAGSVTNGTEIGVSGIHAKDDGSVSIDSAVAGGGMSSVINQKKDSITSAVGDGTNSTVISQDKDNVIIASSKGMVGIVGKDIVNNAQNTITNTAGTSITNQVNDSKVTTDANGTTFENNTPAVSDGGATTTKINGNLITTGRVDANELGVSDKDGANTADLSVKAGEGVKASAGNGTTTGSLDVKADEVVSSVKDADGKGSTFKQRIDAIMMESKDVSIKAEETLTNEAKVITNKASEVINNEAVNINNTATGIITSKASEIKNEANQLISNKVGENTWENMEDGKITTSIKNGTKQNLTQSDAEKTEHSVVNGSNSTVNKQTSEEITDAVTNGTTTNVTQNTATSSNNTIADTNGNANTVVSTVDGTKFTNTGANTAIGEGTVTDTTIKGNTITTGKVTMDYAEVMKNLGVRGNANIAGKTTTGELEVTGKSTLKGDVTMESNATVKKDLTVEGTTTTKTLHVTENATVGGTLDVAKKATFGDSVSIAKDLSVDGNATIKGDVTAKSYKVGDKTYISAAGINANDQKITNVADGSISEGSKDAVNGGQLYTVKNDLEGKVNKVGANAAAMANLHPMEFDPSSKWNIAAAIGNYGSETAAALGAFYRPNDDVMVNLSTAFGTGENMVGGGVSVRLGKGGNKLSREETNALKAQVADLTARMDALLSVLNPNMSKDFPDVPENHWAYEAVSRLAGNDIVQGYPDGEFHGERTMTRYEMAEIIYNALSRGAEAEKELVEEFKPELQAMAASEKATAEKAEG